MPAASSEEIGIVSTAVLLAFTTHGAAQFWLIGGALVAPIATHAMLVTAVAL